MNRWFGTKEDSLAQASARSSRAARRTIASLPKVVLSSDDDEAAYEDAENSFRLPQLDGDDDEEDVVAGEQSQNNSLAMAQPFDLEDKDNDAEAWKKDVRTKFDQNDVPYFFNAIEAEMKKHGINKQWDKKNALVTVLPAEIIEECKPILRLSEEEAGAQVYKDLKTEILSLYGPREEDAFKKAIALKMTGKPSALGKKLIHIICPGAKPFTNCHCANMVYGFWEAQLTPAIRTKISGQKFNKDTYTNLFKQADDVWLANGGGAATGPSVIAAVTNPSSFEGADGNPQVAAIRGGRGRGRGGRNGYQNRGGRGGSARGGNNNTSSSSSTTSNEGQNQNQKPHQKGPKHADLPKNASWACAQHWRKGRSAPYCSDPTVCQWNNVYVART